MSGLDLFSCITEPKVRMRGTASEPTEPSELFDDTSAGLTGGDKRPVAYAGQNLLSDPMSNFAMAYGSSLATHGKEMMDKNVSDITFTVSYKRLHHYFFISNIGNVILCYWRIILLCIEMHAMFKTSRKSSIALLLLEASLCAYLFGIRHNYVMLYGTNPWQTWS